MQTNSALESLDTAAREGKLTDGAVKNIRAWLTEPRYAQYAPQVAEYIDQKKWQELDDAFWTVIPFGTGGRRGRMAPFGTNTINDRTIGESAQGLADYVREHHEGSELSCAIAYDTRHRSPEFAQLSAEIMAAAGFKVYFLKGYRSTPELSFAVRYWNCSCGIMVTASHNPPSDNAVKVYWAGGVQILPPHDALIIDRVMNVDEIHRVPFDDALAEGKIVLCQEETDDAFVRAVAQLAIAGPRDIKILYSPLHGVGTTAIRPVLEADDFADVDVFALHAEPNGDFPNVPGNVSNPENPAVFDAIIAEAQQTGAELVLASDPDCDRIGAATPVSTAPDAPWATFTGNQIAALLTEYVLDARQQAGSLTSDHYVVKTLVTTELVRRIADQYGVRTIGDLLVGFKWIGGAIDDHGPDGFVFGAEESHGYLAGTHVRDKDAAVAAMLLAELAAKLKARGRTLYGHLEALFWQYGAHAERTISVMMPGAEGMAQIKVLMARLRSDPPRELAGIEVAQVRDYLSQTVGPPGSEPQSLAGPQGDLVMLDLAAEGNYVAVRPSGTEPKVKFYLFTYEPPEQIADLEDTMSELNERLDSLERDLTAAANAE